ncbi:MAG: ParB/RepB/Spo0J family partition protein [Puniceicoccales bacterium]|jgi:ParB family chromosome partitioning protein|nr:ParB/RepB/Spo0J family partition protein [Puniceicoccales bacterium]
MTTPKKSLGRGLDALISSGARVLAKPVLASEPPPPSPLPPLEAPAPLGAQAPEAAFPYQEIPVGKIVPARWQPRREIDAQSLQELADSIQSEGLLQPIVVRKIEDGFELIAGERRWRAFQKLTLKTIPARIVNASDAATAAMTLIENLQREGLNPIEEAVAYASLMRDFNLTQESVSERVGKPRATVANSVRLLSLGREIQGYLSKNMLSAGHAKVILSLESEADQMLVARRVVETGASVRETEAIVKKLKDAKPVASRTGLPPLDTRRAAEVTTAIADIEKRLISRLNTKVQVRHGQRHGRIVIEYYGNDDLHRILEKLGEK